MADKVEREFHELYGGEVVIEFLPKSHRYNLIKDGEELPKKKSLSGPTSIINIDKSNILIGWAVKMYTERVEELMEGGVNFTKDDVLSMIALGEKAHTEKKQKAADIGSYVHQFCEEYSDCLNADVAFEYMETKLGEVPDNMEKQVNHGIKGFVEWLTNEGVKILSAEKIVYSRKHGYTGRYDALVEHKGKKYLVDYKTSNGIYNEHYYQASAYLKAHEEETGEKLDGAMIVAIVKEDKLDKDGNVVRKAGDVLPETRSREELVKDFMVFKAQIVTWRREKELKKEWVANNKK